MNKKDYHNCHSSIDLFTYAVQNAIIKALHSDIRVKDLEKGHYIYHSPLKNALSDGAPAFKVFHAAIEVIRYSIEHNDNPDLLPHLIINELLIAISVMGLNIHCVEKKKYGGTIADPHPKS